MTQEEKQLMDTNGHTPLYEDYVSFETAKLLKEKGFDEPVQMYVKTYNYPSDTVIQSIKKITGKNAEQIEVHSLFNSEDEPFFNSVEGKDENLFACPTLQMAMKWLREKHKLHCDIGYDDLDWCWNIISVSDDVPVGDRPKFLKEGYAGILTYEQACEAAILYTIKNLI